MLPIRLDGQLLLLGLVWYVVGLILWALILPLVPPLTVLIGLIGWIKGRLEVCRLIARVWVRLGGRIPKMGKGL